MSTSMKDLIRLTHVTMECPDPFPLFVWGGPGCAKSSGGYKAARLSGRKSAVVIGAIHDPTDFSGMPFRSACGTYTDHLPPEFFHDAEAGNYLIILDEVTSCPPAVQAAMMRLVLERKIGNRSLPDSSRLMLIGNPPDVAANGHDVADPLANRVIHVEFNGPTLDEWSGNEGGHDDDSLKLEKMDMELYEKRFRVISSQMAGYFKKLGGVQTEDVSKVRGRFPMAYATHRSWSAYARHAAAAEALGFSDLTLQIGIGLVGEGHAVQFEEARRSMSMPDPEDLVEGTASWEPDPDRPDVTFAVVRAVALAATAGKDAKNARYGKRWRNAWKVLEAARPEGDDFVALAARILVAEKARPADWAKEPIVVRLASELSIVLKEAQQ